ncbi:hypothetical protein [Lottiidibacillus patelloidae]|uniref:hypothetical protein n=1 Tax=Lottiidibacillus patelloidae TaxID=2670334 RepID=UPI0013036D89|nr:hypothetical protein [Lottiidibacillus patelloidae]
MSLVILAIAIYLTYYTIRYGLLVRKEESKGASIVIFILASTFIPLMIWLNYFSNK